MTLTDPRLAYGSLPVLIWTAGADGTCDYLNERWGEFTGLPVADMLGWAWLERVHPDDRKRVVAEYAGAVAARGPVRLEFRMLHQDGEHRWEGALAASRPGLRPGSYVTLEVSHTGAGPDSEALARVFARPAGGAGGQDADLSPVADIARQSGGHIAVESAPGAGTTFTLYLPRLHEAARSPDESEAAAANGSETVLLVEDDAQVRDVGRRALERAGYVVLAVDDAEAAIAVADRHPGHIHLLVTDVALPGVSGRELAARLAIHRPAIKVLYVSSTSDGAIARHRMLEPGTEFLEKPFSLDRLLRKVRQVLGAGLSAEDTTPWTQRSLV